jgi:hypothetical protein
MMTNMDVARICHEVNRAYCAAHGDTSHLSWDEAPDWQRESALAGVQAIVDNPHMTPEHAHLGWLSQKAAEGWVYGAVKDATRKTHPCIVPYADLPLADRVKDHLFVAVVRAAMKAAGATGV